MYYIIRLDHHGAWQGMAAKFRYLNQAKKFLDNDNDCKRIGMVAYRRIFANDRNCYSHVIIKSDAKCNGDTTGELRPPDDERAREDFFDDIDKVLNLLEANVKLLTDWDYKI